MPIYLELTIAFIVLIASLLILLLILLTIAGILWSPFADAMCKRDARRRSLPAETYHNAGYRYSLQMLLPAIYLTRLLSISKKPLSTTAIRIGIILIYVIWANAILFGFGFFIGGFLHPEAAFGPLGRYSAHFGVISHIGAILIALAPPVLNSFLLVRCVLSLQRKRRADAANPKRAADRCALPDKAYTRPFAIIPWMFILAIIAWLYIAFGIYGACAFGC